MATLIQKKNTKNTRERNAFLMVFLISFSALTLLFAWLIYGQFAQVFTKAGTCTVLSAQTTQDPVDLDNPTTGGAQYAIIFKVSLLTPDGQRFQVPGYYRSANFDASDPNSIGVILKSYPVGSTTACGYTYLDPSGIKALFAPSTPLEGFLFPLAFFVGFLVLTIICIVALRRGPPPEVPFPDELNEVPAEM
ncbi:MAG: hypothetical protein ACRDHZ_11770 [Ktedonobacteraceae bacterium]